MSEATDSVKAIVRNVINGVRTVNELRRCGCGDCRAALVLLAFSKEKDELPESEKKALEKPITTCQCCGNRPAKRIGPPCSKRYLCQPCMMDPSPTFEGCEHGEED